MMAASLKLLKSDELLFKSLLVELTEGGDVERFRVRIQENRRRNESSYSVSVDGSSFGNPEEIALLKADEEGNFRPTDWWGVNLLEVSYGSDLEAAAVAAAEAWLKRVGA
jgi:hypothetical protein